MGAWLGHGGSEVGSVRLPSAVPKGSVSWGLSSVCPGRRARPRGFAVRGTLTSLQACVRPKHELQLRSLTPQTLSVPSMSISPKPWDFQTTGLVWIITLALY